MMGPIGACGEQSCPDEVLYSLLILVLTSDA